jgi:hypothetical protein
VIAVLNGPSAFINDATRVLQAALS